MLKVHALVLCISMYRNFKISHRVTEITEIFYFAFQFSEFPFPIIFLINL